MAKVWKKLQRSDADYTGNVTGTVDGETAANIKTKAIAGAASKVVTDAAFTNNVLNVANANDALKNANTTATDVGLGNVTNKSEAQLLAGNLTGTIGGTAIATVKSGAASGATANQDSTSTILSGTLTGNVSGTVDGVAVGTIKAGAASGATANQDSTSTILGGNLTGQVGGTAVATIKSGAASGATANQDSTSTILGGNLTGSVSGTAVATIKSGAASGALIAPAFDTSGSSPIIKVANAPSTMINSNTTASDVGLGNVTNASQATIQSATLSAATKADVGLSAVDNTADSAKPVSTAQATSIALRAPKANPTFTGTVSGVSKTHVGLGSVIDQAITVVGEKLKFGGVAQTINADKVGGKTVEQTEASASSTAQLAIIGGAPGALNTLDELAAALGDDANYATATTNALATKGKAPMILVAEDVDGDSTYTNDPASEVVGQIGVFGGNQYIVVDI